MPTIDFKYAYFLATITMIIFIIQLVKHFAGFLQNEPHHFNEVWKFTICEWMILLNIFYIFT